ncbi:MAG: DNA polymerase III subunit delta [Planctomycetaceae bacterium]
MHATDFLSRKHAYSHVPVVVVYGSERYLKLEALKRIPGFSGGDDVELTRVPGKDADLRSVVDELLTVSMFGDQRIVMIDDADDFIKDNRPGLEKYVAHPSKASLLILDVKSWPKNTKLAKAVEKTGLAVECTPLTGAVLLKWLEKSATEEFGKVLVPSAAALMIQLAGDSLGMLEQELAKLAALVGDNQTITEDDVTRVVGGWRLETTWHMLDAVRDGNVAFAIENLDKLIVSGEHPIKILGGVTFVFRKYAEATEIARQTRDLPGALRTAGVFPGAVAASEKYLRRIGYDKACQLLQWLVEADHNLKGGSRVEPRLQLERLFVQLAG